MVLKNRKIAVIGAGITDSKIYQLAYEVGKLLGERGVILYTGGLGGVMEAASKGAFEAGAITVGILPSTKAHDANPYVKIPVATGMGQARNVILVTSVEAVVSIAGGFGTLSEIALALKLWKPVIGLNTWENIPDVQYVNTPQEVIERLEELFS